MKCVECKLDKFMNSELLYNIKICSLFAVIDICKNSVNGWYVIKRNAIVNKAFALICCLLGFFPKGL